MDGLFSWASPICLAISVPNSDVISACHKPKSVVRNTLYHNVGKYCLFAAIRHRPTDFLHKK